MNIISISRIGLLFGFFASGILGFFLLPLLRRLKMGQTVRELGPKAHYKKSGTPTMGGLFFCIPCYMFSLFCLVRDYRPEALGLLLLSLGMGLIGFLDDYVKVKVSKEGLTVRQKTLAMLGLLLIFAIYYCYLRPVPPQIVWPGGASWVLDGFWRAPYAIFIVIFLYYTINAVNLTDGEDGLLSAVSLPALLSMLVIAIEFEARHSSGLYVLPLVLIGGLLSFLLLFNRHPARVFMGDFGSLSIGAVYAGLCIYLNMPWLLLLSGFIYLVEALSVVIQVCYFKATGGKRIFRMSPIHHHFELGGWSENKIDLVFSALTFVLSIVAVILARSAI